MTNSIVLTSFVPVLGCFIFSFGLLLFKTLYKKCIVLQYWLGSLAYQDSILYYITVQKFEVSIIFFFFMNK